MGARNKKMARDARKASNKPGVRPTDFEGRRQWNHKLGFWETAKDFFLQLTTAWRIGFMGFFLLALCIYVGLPVILHWWLPGQPNVVNNYEPGSRPCIQCTIYNGSIMPRSSDLALTKNSNNPRYDSEDHTGVR